jgi:hypothetical protein
MLRYLLIRSGLAGLLLVLAAGAAAAQELYSPAIWVL